MGRAHVSVLKKLDMHSGSELKQNRFCKTYIAVTFIVNKLLVYLLRIQIELNYIIF